MKLLKSLLYSLALLNLAPAHAQHQHQDLEKDLTQYEAARKAGTLTYDAAMKYGTLFMNSKLKDHTAPPLLIWALLLIVDGRSWQIPFLRILPG